MTQPTARPMLSPECESVGSLLPLLAHGMLDDARTARVRVHLATCAGCRAELALHDQVDAALRRAAAQPADAASLPFTRRDLLAVTQIPETVRTRGIHGPSRPRIWRRLGAGVPAVAAVLLLALLARYVFSLGPHAPTPGSLPTAPISPAAILPPNLDIKSIAGVGNEAVWAVGNTLPDPRCAAGGCGTATTPYVQPVLLFLQAGHWERFLALPALHRTDYSWELNGIALVSPTEGWAVGNTVLPSTTDGETSGILLHDVNGQWAVANLGLGAQLNAIALDSPTTGWIAGIDAAGNPLILHGAAGVWAPVHAAAFAGVRVSAIAAPGPHAIWMIGTDYSNPSAGNGAGFEGNAPSVILHYDGVGWTRQPNPSPHTELLGLTMLSPTLGWAVGGEQASTPGGGAAAPAVARILRYQDGVWTVQAGFNAPTGTGPFAFDAVAMTSGADGWAVGTAGLMAHYDGAGWSLMPRLTTADLNALALPPGGSGWAMGSASAVLRNTLGKWSAYSATTTTP